MTVEDPTAEHTTAENPTAERPTAENPTVALTGAGLTDADIARLRLVVLRLARRIRTHSVEEITPSQLAVLGTVVRHERLTVGQIADIEHVKPPSVSKIVAALERVGYLEREHDRHDRRCVYLTATPTGADYLDSVRAAGRSWLATQLATIDADDLRLVGSAIPALERLLEGEA